MHLSLVSCVAFAALVLTPSASSQCVDWSSSFGTAGTSGTAYALASADFGGGARLYAGGDFETAGNQLVWRLGEWNGAYWTGLPGGLGARCWTAISGDDGSGPALFVGGEFQIAGGLAARSVAKWNGTSWSSFAPGFNGPVRALTLFDDGSGPKLIAGGTFGFVTSGPPVNGIARWNGASWQPMANGLGSAFALAVHDDGSGPKLYAGGSFTLSTPSGLVRGLARWNGVAWEGVGANLTGHETVNALCSTNASGTNELWLAGAFTQSGGVATVNVARWNGTSFTSAGAGLAPAVKALVEYDDGSGARIVAGGDFTASGATPLSHVARFDGAQWTALAAGANDGVEALTVHMQGGAPLLVVAGEFTRAGTVGASHVAAWNGASWSAFGAGYGIEGRVVTLDVVDEASGKALYAGGNFVSAGGTKVDRIARWNGNGWRALPGTFVHATSGVGPQVRAIASFDDGTGLDLYVAGYFTSVDGLATPNIARWNGSAWSALGSGAGQAYGLVSALIVFDDGSGPALYVGGFFDTAGGVTGPNIARWDGHQWTTTGAAPEAFDFAVFDDGGGAKLYSAGYGSIARYDGTIWTTLAGGGSSPLGATSLAVFDDGNGRALYAGGWFSLGGSNVARWTGSGWVGLAGGMSGTIPWELQSFGTSVSSLAVFDDGAGGGPALYAIGSFTHAGGVPATGIARWDGSLWSALASGVAPGGAALAVHDDGTSGGPALYVAGVVSLAGDLGVQNISRWQRSTASGCEAHTGIALCFGDGTGSACPCGNFGGPGRGCASASNSAGARIEAFGRAHVAYDDVQLAASGMPATTTALVFQGTQRVLLGLGAPFGDGLRCAGGSVIRLATRAAVGGIVTFGHGVAGDPSLSSAGAIPASGATRIYQAWYRDAQPFCTSATYNLTNGLEVRWAP